MISQNAVPRATERIQRNLKTVDKAKYQSDYPKSGCLNPKGGARRYPFKARKKAGISFKPEMEKKAGFLSR